MVYIYILQLEDNKYYSKKRCDTRNNRRNYYRCYYN